MTASLLEENSPDAAAPDAGAPDPRPGAAPPGIIAIGASTGGTEAIKRLLAGLPATLPGIVITQHIPAEFTGSFTERLDVVSAIEVTEARDRQPIVAGHAYVAPGGKHLCVKRVGDGFQCRLDDGPEVNRHKPSVDVMFRSVAAAAGGASIGILLTGMGDDGADAIGELKRAGAMTFAQDEASSVVWGMPGEAVRRGHVTHVLPPPMIAAKLKRLLAERQRG